MLSLSTVTACAAATDGAAGHEDADSQDVPVVAELVQQPTVYGTGRGTVSNCTASQAAAASDAQAGALWILNANLNNFASHQAERDRWFGTVYGTSDAAIFLQGAHTTTIVNSLHIMLDVANGNPAPAVSCEPWGGTCNQGAHTLAWTLRGDVMTVHLCPSFFDLPHDSAEANKTKSRVGTILHEYAHAGGMTDIYGWQAARNLAATDPLRAANNADNYAFYLMGGP